MDGETKLKTSKSWKDRIASAKKNGNFTMKDIQDANNFNYCAVGELFGITPRKSVMDLTSEVRNLAYRFNEAVQRCQFKRAEQIYNRIAKLAQKSKK